MSQSSRRHADENYWTLMNEKILLREDNTLHPPSNFAGCFVHQVFLVVVFLP